MPKSLRNQKRAEKRHARIMLKFDAEFDAGAPKGSFFGDLGGLDLP